MKCEHCGNAMKWVGSLMSGHLECEHCTNDDNLMFEACRSGGVEFSAAEKTANFLTCEKTCSMRGGSDWCVCCGEPSCLKVVDINDDISIVTHVKLWLGVR